MKALVRYGYGSPDVLQLEELATPTLTDDEVLVRVHAAGVNMADVEFLRGRPTIGRLGTGSRTPRNRVPGLEVAGQVQAIGTGVTRFQPGDEVFGDLTDYGFGAFAEYACAAEGAWAQKLTNLPFEEAAAVPQAAVMAVHGLRGKRPMQPRKRTSPAPAPMTVRRCGSVASRLSDRWQRRVGAPGPRGS